MILFLFDLVSVFMVSFCFPCPCSSVSMCAFAYNIMPRCLRFKIESACDYVSYNGKKGLSSSLVRGSGESTHEVQRSRLFLLCLTFQRQSFSFGRNSESSFRNCFLSFVPWFLVRYVLSFVCVCVCVCVCVMFFHRVALLSRIQHVERNK